MIRIMLRRLTQPNHSAWIPTSWIGTKYPSRRLSSAWYFPSRAPVAFWWVVRNGGGNVPDWDPRWAPRQMPSCRSRTF